MDKIHSASVKNDPDFCHPVTWQQSAPELEKSRLVNNGYKLNEQLGFEKPKTVTWFF